MGISLVDAVNDWRREEAGIMPDMNEVARPLAVPSPQNNGEASSASLRVRPVDGHSVAAGAGGNGVTIPKTPQGGSAAPVSRYFMTPALRTTFEAVGATDKAYSFKEVLGFLKAYLYSKRYLFDADNILFVNCKNDLLGDVLKVDRFHYNDVRSLFAKHVVPESKCQDLKPPVESVSKNNVETNNIASKNEVETNNIANKNEVETNDIANNGLDHIPVGALLSNSSDPIPSINDKTSCKETPVNGVSSQGPAKVETQNTSSTPGCSRQYSGNSTSRKRRHSSNLSTVTIEFTLPDVPEVVSDSESVYSCQGYETAYCRNTEFEDSDSEYFEEIEFEEYEVPDDEDDQEIEHSDECDSSVEEVTFLAVHALYDDDDDELEEEFWAEDDLTEDSDTEEHSTDSDPELVKEKWDCIKCGIKNKPFVRYCGKCWQLRKDWLPERPRPKKKRRKPRPKKKLRRRTNSIQSDASITDCKDSESLRREDSGHGSEDLIRTSSTATTVSLGSSTPPRSFSDHFSSQDSGICVSEDFSTESSQDIAMADAEVKPSSSEGTEVKPSISEGTEVKPSSSRDTEVKSNVGESVCEEIDGLVSSSRKRKSVEVEEEIRTKRTKVLSTEEISADGKNILKDKFQKEFQQFMDMDLSLESHVMKECQKKLIDFQKCMDNIGHEDFQKCMDNIGHESESDAARMCLICCSRPKNAVITHGRISHQATCYQCARRLLDTKSRCPVCRRKIHMVSKNIVV